MSLLVKDEALRLEALSQYEVLNNAPDAILDDLVRLTARTCDTPVAAISLIDADRLWLRARFGIRATELSLGSTACETTILGDTSYEIVDARVDPDFAPRGILIDGREFRFYAGVPLTTPGGVAIGSLFVLDEQPRRLTQTEAEGLTILARLVISRLELNSRVRQIDRAARSRQRVENALTVERNFVSAVLDTVGALVVVFDTAGRIVRFNRACELASGYDFNILVGRYAWDRLIPEEDVDDAIATFDKLRAGGFPAVFENRWRNRDGSLPAASPGPPRALLDQQGQVGFIIATGIDVTEQRAAESTLRESEARYRQLIEGSLGMICTHDLRTAKARSPSNQHAATSLGRTVDEIIGRLPAPTSSPSERSPQHGGLPQRDHRTSGEAQGLLHLCHANGEVLVVAYRNKLINLPGPRALRARLRRRHHRRESDSKATSVTLTRQSDSILESVGDGIFGIDLARVRSPSSTPPPPRCSATAPAS